MERLEKSNSKNMAKICLLALKALQRKLVVKKFG